MKIKEDREFNIPRVMFHTIWANFIFLVLLAAMFINTILFLADYISIKLVPLGLMLFGLIRS